LTLLKAIAGGQSNKLRIENNPDGVTMHFPVEITSPKVLKRWTKFIGEDSNTAESSVLLPPHALATSVPATPASIAVSGDSPPENPLTIELKCRKCSSKGPEVSSFSL
jgi:hypothetical protein